MTSSKEEINIPSAAPEADTTESSVSSNTSFFYSNSSASNLQSEQEREEEQSDVTTGVPSFEIIENELKLMDTEEQQGDFVFNNDGDDDEKKKGSKEELPQKLRKVGMPGFLNFLSTSNGPTARTTAAVFFYKNQTENSSLVDYSENSTSDDSKNIFN